MVRLPYNTPELQESFSPSKAVDQARNVEGILHHGLSMENLIYKLKQGATGTLALFVNLYDILTSRHLEHARNDVLRSIYSPLGLCDDHTFGNACLSLNSSISPNLLDMVHGTARHLSVVKVSTTIASSSAQVLWHREENAVFLSDYSSLQVLGSRNVVTHG